MKCTENAHAHLFSKRKKYVDQRGDLFPPPDGRTIRQSASFPSLCRRPCFCYTIVPLTYTDWVRKFYTLKVLKTFFQRPKSFAPYFTRICGDQIYAQLQSFISLFLNLIKLCHTMRAHAENLSFSLESPLYGPHRTLWANKIRATKCVSTLPCEI